MPVPELPPPDNWLPKERNATYIFGNDEVTAAGQLVEISAVMAIHVAAGKPAYVIGQRGVVVELQEEKAIIQLIAAPPNYPYLHFHHAELFLVPLNELRQIRALPFYKEPAKKFAKEAIRKARERLGSEETPSEPASQVSLF